MREGRRCRPGARDARRRTFSWKRRATSLTRSRAVVSGDGLPRPSIRRLTGGFAREEEEAQV